MILLGKGTRSKSSGQERAKVLKPRQLELDRLALGGVNEQNGHQVADGRADTQRNVKHSDELQCRHGNLGYSREPHSSLL